MVENLHHPLTRNHLFNVAVHRTQGLLLADEVLAGLSRQELCDKDNQGNGEEHDDEQHPAGGNQAPGHHEQGNDGGHTLGQGLTHHLAQGVDVAGIAGHDVARGVGVEVPQGQLLHFPEHFVPDGLLGPLGHRHQQIVHEEGTQNTHAKDAGNLKEVGGHRAKILGAGGHHGQDVVIHQGAQAPAAHGLGVGGEEDAQKHDQQHRGVLFQIAQEPQQRLFRAFRHAAVAAHFHRGHDSSLPFCWVSYRSW